MSKVQVQGPWPTVFELSVGQTVQLAGPAGITKIVLQEVEHYFEPDLVTGKSPNQQTYRAAKVQLMVDGQPAALWLRGYQMPVTLGHVRLSVEETGEWAASGGLGGGRHRVSGDVKLSAVPKDSTWGPADLRFPILNYRHRSSSYRNTWAALVPFNVHYYHRGEDFGAIPDQLDIIAVKPGTITATPLPNGDGRSNAITIDMGQGAVFRYSHMNTESINPAFPKDAHVKAGDVLAKTGMTWNGGRNQHNDPHVHTDLQIQGGTVNCYASLMEAYFRDYDDTLLALAGGFGFATPGQTYELDGTRSQARPGRTITSYQWILHDGTVIDGPIASVKLNKPGYYAQELIVKADNGEEDRDAIHLCVIDPQSPGNYGAGWAYYHPSRDIKPGTSVMFWSRLAAADQTIDFGDGSAAQTIAGGLHHAYEKPGLYTVSIRGTAGNGPVLHKMRLRVLEP